MTIEIAAKKPKLVPGKNWKAHADHLDLSHHKVQLKYHSKLFRKHDKIAEGAPNTKKGEHHRIKAEEHGAWSEAHHGVIRSLDKVKAEHTNNSVEDTKD